VEARDFARLKAPRAERDGEQAVADAVDRVEVADIARVERGVVAVLTLLTVLSLDDDGRVERREVCVDEVVVPVLDLVEQPELRLVARVLDVDAFGGRARAGPPRSSRPDRRSPSSGRHSRPCTHPRTRSVESA